MTEPPVGTDMVIRTQRLDLHTVLPAEYALLAVDRADPRLWVDRGFTNPIGHLVSDPGPLPYRLPRVAADPAAAPFLMRVAVLRSAAVIVGGAGFHDRPDADGMVEIGLSVEEEYRRSGLATEMLYGMWDWVVGKEGVRTLRYTVSPDNHASLALLRRFGFAYVGQQIDDVDGPEDIYELPAAAYRQARGL